MVEEEEEGAGWRVERTNSGESILEMWDRKVSFHGAGLEGVLLVVVDMVRRREVRRRGALQEAMVAVGYVPD